MARFLKILVIFMGIVALLVALLQILVLLPPVHNRLKSMALEAAKKQINADISIGKVRLWIPEKIIVYNLVVKANQTDTLFYQGRTSLRLRLLPLLSRKVVVQSLKLEDGYGDFGRLIDRIPADTSTSDMPEAGTDPSKAWKAEIRNLTATNCYYRYRDEKESGFDLILDIGQATVKLRTLDFDSIISARFFRAENTRVSYESLDIPGNPEDDTSRTSVFDIFVDEADLTGSEFNYIDSTAALIFKAGGDKVQVTDLLVDVNNESVTIDDGRVSGVECTIDFLPGTDTSEVAESSGLNWGPSLWRVKGTHLKMDRFRFAMDYTGTPDLYGHFNGDHLDIHDVTGHLNGFLVDEDTLTVVFKHLSAREKNGLDIRQLDGEFETSESLFIVRGMDLTTANASYSIDLETEMSPTNYDNLEGLKHKLSFEAKGGNLKDLDYFIPIGDILPGASAGVTDSPFEIAADLEGDIFNMDIARLNMKLFNTTSVDLQGSIRGLEEAGTTTIDLAIGEFATSLADVRSILPGEIPDTGIRFPELITMQGQYRAHGLSHQFSGSFMTDLGRLNIEEAVIHLGEIPQYYARLQVNIFNLQDLAPYGIGEVDLSIDASFAGKDIYTGSGEAEMEIQRMQTVNYEFHDIRLDGNLQKGDLAVRLNSADSNALFTFSLMGTIEPDRYDIGTDLQFENLDLDALRFYPDDAGLRGSASVRLIYEEERELDMKGSFHDLQAHLVDSAYFLQELNLEYHSSGSGTNAEITSGSNFLHFGCDSDIATFADSLSRITDKFNSSAELRSAGPLMPGFYLEGRIEYPESFARQLFPEIPGFTKLEVKGFYDENSDSLQLEALVPGLYYGNITTDSLEVSISGSVELLRYRFASGVVIDSFLEGKIMMEGEIVRGTLMNHLQYFDSFGAPYIDLHTKASQADSGIVLGIIPDPFIFSYDPWDIPATNSVVITSTGIGFNDFVMSGAGQEISILTLPDEGMQSIHLTLRDFNLGSLENLLSLDTLVRGNASAEIEIHRILSDPEIEGKLSISNLNAFDFDLGRLDISSFSFDGNRADAVLTLRGEKEDISVDLSWDGSVDPNRIESDLDIHSLNLEELNYLLQDYLENASGSLTGHLNLKGTLDQPVINGTLGFRDAGATIKALDNHFTFGNENIGITDNVIDFGSLSIANNQNQTARITGTVSVNPDRMVHHDLHLSTDNMVLMNSTRADNDMLFGFLKLQTDFRIMGTMRETEVFATLNIDEATGITYIFPESLALDDNSGTVEFIDFRADTIRQNKLTDQPSFFNMAAFKNIRTSINLDRGAKFRLLFDPGGTSYLDATLAGRINYNLAGGNPEVAGMLEIQSGRLKYGIPMVSADKYEIEPGSYLTISNDLYNPYLNIVASTMIRASTESLMSNYAKVMTFKVLLLLSGELDDLKMTFDISTETDDAMVSARLAQLTPEERSMNALNLLVRGSFVFSMHSDNIGGTSMADAVLDNFYASQLNHLISENIHFVDVSFDVQSYKDYNASGDKIFQRNFYYNIGKSFFKDRARISYKGSLGLTSNMQSENNNSQFVEDELEVEVKITNNGNLRGVFFRKNEYEGLLEGDLISTGGGLRWKKEFYNIRDIFSSDVKHTRKPATQEGQAPVRIDEK